MSSWHDPSYASPATRGPYVPSAPTAVAHSSVFTQPFVPQQASQAQTYVPQASSQAASSSTGPSIMHPPSSNPHYTRPSQSLDPPTSPETKNYWQCPKCDWVNSSTAGTCNACRGPKPGAGGTDNGSSGVGFHPPPATAEPVQPYSYTLPHCPTPGHSRPYRSTLQQQQQPQQHPAVPAAPEAPPGQKLIRVEVPPGTPAGATVHVPVPGGGGQEVAAVVPPDVTEFYVAYQPQEQQHQAPAPMVYAANGSTPGPSAYATSSAAASALAPTPAHSIGVHATTASLTTRAQLQVFDDSKFVVQSRVTLVLKEKPFSFSGDSFSIKDTDRRTWFQVKGRAFSFREKKVLHDASGSPIFVMKEGFDFGPDRQYVYDPCQNVKGKHMFVIEPKLTFFKAKMHSTVNNRVDGRQVRVVLKGVPTKREAGIFIGEPKQGGERIGLIQRKLTGSDFFFDKQTYALTIEPGVDAALMVAFCIAFDELANDDR